MQSEIDKIKTDVAGRQKDLDQYSAALERVKVNLQQRPAGYMRK
jgi:hypothetical protein